MKGCLILLTWYVLCTCGLKDRLYDDINVEGEVKLDTSCFQNPTTHSGSIHETIWDFQRKPIDSVEKGCRISWHMDLSGVKVTACRIRAPAFVVPISYASLANAITQKILPSSKSSSRLDDKLVHERIREVFTQTTSRIALSRISIDMRFLSSCLTGTFRVIEVNDTELSACAPFAHRIPSFTEVHMDANILVARTRRLIGQSVMSVVQDSVAVPTAGLLVLMDGNCVTDLSALSSEVNITVEVFFVGTGWTFTMPPFEPIMSSRNAILTCADPQYSSVCDHLIDTAKYPLYDQCARDYIPAGEVCYYNELWQSAYVGPKWFGMIMPRGQVSQEMRVAFDLGGNLIAGGDTELNKVALPINSAPECSALLPSAFYLLPPRGYGNITSIPTDRASALDGAAISRTNSDAYTYYTFGTTVEMTPGRSRIVIIPFVRNQTECHLKWTQHPLKVLIRRRLYGGTGTTTSSGDPTTWNSYSDNMAAGIPMFTWQGINLFGIVLLLLL